MFDRTSFALGESGPAHFWRDIPGYSGPARPTFFTTVWNSRQSEHRFMRWCNQVREVDTYCGGLVIDFVGEDSEDERALSIAWSRRAADGHQAAIVSINCLFLTTCGSRTCKPNTPGHIANTQFIEWKRATESMMSLLVVMAGCASHRRHRDADAPDDPAYQSSNELRPQASTLGRSLYH